MPNESIFHPTVQKIVTGYGPAIDASFNGAISSVQNDPFAFVLYDDLWFHFCIWFGGNSWRVFLRVKNDGRFCWYADTPSYKNVNWTGQYTNQNTYAPLLNNNVVVSQTVSNIKTVTLPAHFEDGGWIYIPSYALSIPVPCGHVGYPFKIMLAANGRALVEFYDSFPDEYDLYASTGAYVNGVFSADNSGYVGHFPTGVDPIFQNSALSNLGNLEYGCGNGAVSYMQNSLHGKNIYFKDLIGHYDAFFNASVVSGALNCAGTGQSLPSATIEYFRILDRNATEFNGLQFKTSQTSGNTSACDIQNVFCIGNLSGELALFDGSSFIGIEPSAPIGQYGETGIGGIINNTAIQVESKSPPKIFVSQPLKLPNLGPPPTVGLNASTLLNWHRPVSTTGKFIT